MIVIVLNAGMVRVSAVMVQIMTQGYNEKPIAIIHKKQKKKKKMKKKIYIQNRA